MAAPPPPPSPPTLVPRGYQLELFHRAYASNVIACLDTGAGKTFIAALLMDAVLNDAKAKQPPAAPATPRVVFLAHRVSLVVQQAAALSAQLPNHSVAHYLGASKSKAGCASRPTLPCADALVMTAQLMHNLLSHAHLDLCALSLLVLDEAHNATKAHPYARIFRDFYHTLPPAARPRVFAVTATPVKQQRDVRAHLRCVRAIAQLEAILDATLVAVSPSARQEVEKRVPKPHEYVLLYRNRHPRRQQPAAAQRDPAASAQSDVEPMSAATSPPSTSVASDEEAGDADGEEGEGEEDEEDESDLDVGAREADLDVETMRRLTALAVSGATLFPPAEDTEMGDSGPELVYCKHVVADGVDNAMEVDSPSDQPAGSGDGATRAEQRDAPSATTARLMLPKAELCAVARLHRSLGYTPAIAAARFLCQSLGVPVASTEQALLSDCDAAHIAAGGLRDKAAKLLDLLYAEWRFEQGRSYVAAATTAAAAQPAAGGDTGAGSTAPPAVASAHPGPHGVLQDDPPLPPLDDSFRAIVFVRERVTALVVSLLINQAFAHVGARGLCARPVVGAAGNDSAIRTSRAEMLAAVAGFRDGAFGVLVASNVVEEGIDVPACGLVVSFDGVISSSAYVQARGRARRRDAHYVVFIDEHDEHGMSTWQSARAGADVMDDSAKGAVVSEGVRRGIRDEVFAATFGHERRLYSETTNARVGECEAIALLRRYCVMRGKVCGVLDVREVRFDTVVCDDMFTATARLDERLGVDVCGVCKQPQLREAQAKRVAALDAYERLYRLGEVDEHLLPACGRGGTAEEAGGDGAAGDAAMAAVFDETDCIDQLDALGLD